MMMYCKSKIRISVLSIIYNITTIDTIVNSFITMTGFQQRAQKYSMLMVNVTPKQVGETQ
jgi:hypothetical protein